MQSYDLYLAYTVAAEQRNAWRSKSSDRYWTAWDLHPLSAQNQPAARVTGDAANRQYTDHLHATGQPLYSLEL